MKHNPGASTTPPGKRMSFGRWILGALIMVLLTLLLAFLGNSLQAKANVQAQVKAGCLSKFIRNCQQRVDPGIQRRPCRHRVLIISAYK